MKRILLALCLLFSSAVCVSTFAQKGKTPEQKAEKIVANMDKTLSLNQEQKDKLLILFSKPKDERGKIDSQLKEILTESQYKVYKEAKGTKSAEKAKEGDKKNGR